MSSTHYPNGQSIPAWKRALKFTGKVAGGTVIALVTAALFSLIVFGGAVAGLLNGVKADSSASETTEGQDITSADDVFESVDEPGEGTGVGAPTEAAAEDTIVLEVQTSAPSTVSWTEPGSYGNEAPEPVTGPWTKELTGDNESGLYSVDVSAVDYETPTDVSCRVLVNGEEVTAKEASGPGAIVTCDNY